MKKGESFQWPNSSNRKAEKNKVEKEMAFLRSVATTRVTTAASAIPAFSTTLSPSSSSSQSQCQT